MNSLVDYAASGSVPVLDVASLLADYDAAVAECPITSAPNSRHYQAKGRGVCKRCLATPSQACGREASASHRLIFSLRFILTEAAGEALPVTLPATPPATGNEGRQAEVNKPQSHGGKG